MSPCLILLHRAHNRDKPSVQNAAGDGRPVWLYKNGANLVKTLGEQQMKWFLPLKTWLDSGLMIGGGSDHLGSLDSIDSANPWNLSLGL